MSFLFSIFYQAYSETYYSPLCGGMDACVCGSVEHDPQPPVVYLYIMNDKIQETVLHSCFLCTLLVAAVPVFFCEPHHPAGYGENRMRREKMNEKKN